MIEGKSLAATGQVGVGMEKIQDALNMSPELRSSILYEGAGSMGTSTRADLQAELVTKEKVIAEILCEKKRIDIKADMPQDVITAFAYTQKNWSKAHQSPKYKPYGPLVDNPFVRMNCCRSASRHRVT